MGQHGGATSDWWRPVLHGTIHGMRIIGSDAVDRARSWLDQRWNDVPDPIRRVVQQARTRPGHYYSPYPDLNELAARDDVFAPRAEFAGIDLRESEQLALLETFAATAATLPWTDDPQPDLRPRLRYHYGNRPYAHGDGLFTACMLAHAKPRRYVEIGSGYSTLLALDVRDRLLTGVDTEIVSIEPYPAVLRELLAGERPERFRLIEQKAQDIDPALIESLEANDVLLIDSTHVAKAGSDVNHIFFELLPLVAPGVYVHVHDVFANFEYPREWVFQRRAWSEAYLLRSFLQFNDAFEVVFWGAWLAEHHPERFDRPGAPFAPVMINPGASIWLRRRP